MNADHDSKAWPQIVAKAWSDDAFKKRLLAEPAAVLKEHGVGVPAGIQLRIVEDSASVIHLIVPAQPAGELAVEVLEVVAAGRKDSDCWDIKALSERQLDSVAGGVITIEE